MQRSLTYIILITCITCGLQLSWCSQFSNVSPFLLSLGMSKASLGLIWMGCSFLSILGQPIVGVLSDELRWKFGRRRPFIIAGAFLVAAALMAISWSREIVKSLIGTRYDDTKPVSAAIVLAGCGALLLYFSIYAVDAATRAFMVDNVRSDQQGLANAISACMAGSGNIVGYTLSSVDLPVLFPLLGNTQFQVLAGWAAIALAVTVPTACFFVKEKDPGMQSLVQLEDEEFAAVDAGVSADHRAKTRLTRIFHDMKICFVRMSPQTKNACIAEFFAVIAYFPIFLYTTTYVGEIYTAEFYDRIDPSLLPLGPHELAELAEEATRKGSFALLLYSVVSLVANAVMPLFLKKPVTKGPRDVEDIPDETSALLGIKKSSLKLPMSKLWFCCLFIFFLCMSATFFVGSTVAVTILIGILGIPWAAALWIPMALISEDISKLREKKEAALSDGLSTASINAFCYEHEAGAVLGVHSIFVLLPQLLSSLLSSIVFWALEEENSSSILWVFRVSGLASLVAMYLTLSLKTPEVLDAEYSQQKTDTIV